MTLGSAYVSKIKGRTQGMNMKVFYKEVRQFRAYCCNINSAGIMGVAKEPVPIISISPNPVCLGSSISWNLSNSYAPGSTLTAWDINFGDTQSQSGSDFPNDTTYGNHTYAAVGTYTITVVIEEGLGKTQTSEYEIIVVDCGEALNYTYISTDGDGVYFIDWTADTPVWQEKNFGLEGDALTVRHLVQKPSTQDLQPSQHELWAATKDGVYVTHNGGKSWGKMTLPNPSNVEFGDSPAATVDELDWHTIVFDKEDNETVYVLASKEAP